MNEPSTSPSRARGLARFLLIGFGCAALLGATVQLTRVPIEQNRARQEAGAILRLTGLEAPPVTGRWEDDAWVACDGTILLRGAAAGYGGPIRWMLAADRPSGTPRIRKVLVTAHQETPGIADFLDDPGHAWLAGFAGRGVDVTGLDTISGATITTRALARSIGETLARPIAAASGCPS